jgi:hypothetical protein
LPDSNEEVHSSMIGFTDDMTGVICTEEELNYYIALYAASA